MNKLRSSFSIEPNPSHGVFKFNNFSTASKEIVISDTEGRKIYESAPVEKSFMIDLSAQPKGIYFAKVISGNKITVNKIVIQ